MHREDMETVAPLWYHFTKEVRNDPEVKSFPKRYPRASRNPDRLRRPVLEWQLCSLMRASLVSTEHAG